jgi:hypothetical protein
MENTKAHPSVKGWEDPNNSKYYVVIVQVRWRLWHVTAAAECVQQH